MLTYYYYLLFVCPSYIVICLKERVLEFRQDSINQVQLFLSVMTHEGHSVERLKYNEKAYSIIN